MLRIYDFTIRSHVLPASLIAVLCASNLFAVSSYEIRVAGLVDAEHTSQDGRTFHQSVALNQAGQIIGMSGRFSGSGDMGLSAWLYDDGVTCQLGFWGAEYTRDDGYQYGNVYSLNEAGQMLGTPRRYSGSADMGYSAWLYDHGITTPLGLSGPDYTRDDGYRQSVPDSLNASGQVVGYTCRYNGNAVKGTAAWLYDNGATTRLGLTGPDYTRPDGSQYSDAHQINAAGQVIGSSERVSGHPGRAAWLYDHGVATILGFTDAEHTFSDGRQYSEVKAINNAGQVIGYSERYSGGHMAGQSLWIYDHGATTGLGLTGPEYTRVDGGQNSVFGYVGKCFNQAGQVIGYSSRYNGYSDLGQSAWFYDHGATTKIGLTGPQYTSTANGYQYSFATALNEAGQAIGVSNRFEGPYLDGQVGWLFDSNLNETFSLIFSTDPDGTSFSHPEYLSDDGTVLGSYGLFGSDGTNLGNHAFMWTLSDGFHDLGLLVDGGLSDNGWAQLYSATKINARGDIVGLGGLISQAGGEDGEVVIVMTPVPEPSVLMLLLGALGILAAHTVKCQKR